MKSILIITVATITMVLQFSCNTSSDKFNEFIQKEDHINDSIAMRMRIDSDANWSTILEKYGDTLLSNSLNSSSFISSGKSILSVIQNDTTNNWTKDDKYHIYRFILVTEKDGFKSYQIESKLKTDKEFSSKLINGSRYFSSLCEAKIMLHLLTLFDYERQETKQIIN